MRSPGYPATYDLRGTQREDPAESPQEGAPQQKLRAAGVPPQWEERGAQPKGEYRSAPASEIGLDLSPYYDGKH
jgi:hypothetical protein